MISDARKFILSLVILSIILLIAGLAIFQYFFSAWYFSFFPFLVLIFLLVNSGFIIFFLRYIKLSANEFVRGFMLSTVIKLLLYLILILVYVLSSPRTAIAFSISVSILYISYTAFDLYVMLSLLKRRKEKNSLSREVSN